MQTCTGKVLTSAFLTFWLLSCCLTYSSFKMQKGQQHCSYRQQASLHRG